MKVQFRDAEAAALFVPTPEEQHALIEIKRHGAPAGEAIFDRIIEARPDRAMVISALCGSVSGRLAGKYAKLTLEFEQKRALQTPSTSRTASEQSIDPPPSYTEIHAQALQVDDHPPQEGLRQRKK